MSGYAVDIQERDPASTLNMYRTAIHLRKELLCQESMSWLESPQGTLFFKRPNGWAVFVNTSQNSVPLPDGTVLLTSSTENVESSVPGETAVWLQT